MLNPEVTTAQRRNRRIIYILLAFAVLAGGYFRFVGINWDDFTHLHPDERFLTGVVAGIGFALTDNSPERQEARRVQSEACLDQFEQNGTMPPGCSPLGFTLNNSVPGYATIEEQIAVCLARYPESSGVGGYFDAQCSTMNPHNAGAGFLAYGTLPIFATRWTADAIITVTGDSYWGSYNGIHLVWRALSALADVGVVVLLFATGSRLHNGWVGVLAALLYAAAALPIQKAHYGTVNAITNFFVVLAIYYAARVQTGGGWASYIGFGIGFAGALAGRINTVPLVGVLLLATSIQALPIFDERLTWRERQRLFVGALVGLVIAGITTFLFFRVTNPYAFTGPSIFGVVPNPRWFSDLSSASFGVSGLADGPPNWQWMGRAAYTYPFSHMVLWGMGIALGITAWVGFVWALWRVLRGRPSALANVILVAWVLVYFAWLGRLWVMTMRYYLPIYGALAILAAWALVEFVRLLQTRKVDPWLARALLILFGLTLAAAGVIAGRDPQMITMMVLCVIVGAALLAVGILPPLRRARPYVLAGFVVSFTLLWALMFTNIYRNQLTRVQASHWFNESVSADFSMRVEGAPEGTPLINIAVINGFGQDENNLPGMATQYENGFTITQAFVAPADGTITHVHAPHLGDPLDDANAEAIQVAIFDSSGQALSDGILASNLPRTGHVLGNSYDIRLNLPVEVLAGEEYTFTVQVLEGGPVIGAGAVVAVDASDWDNPIPQKVCQLPFGVTLADNPPPGLVSAAECGGTDPWTASINVISLYNSYPVDDALKRDALLRGVQHADFVTISSNRFYDPVARNRTRWPLTNLFYDELFSGRMGFELVAVFQETFEFGPFRVSDQRLPTFDSPEWLEELEADEAFHVYDHPVVFVFRKTAAYDHQQVVAQFNAVSLVQPNEVPLIGAGCGFFPEKPDCNPAVIGVQNIPSFEAAAASTQLQLTPQLEAAQSEGGTWSNRFNSASLLNTQPIFSVVFWWLTIVLFGWAMFPLLFSLLPALPDRGYAIAKVLGLLLVGWLAWLAASLRIPLWSQEGVLLCLALVGLLSAALVWRGRAAFVEHIRTYWKRLLVIEALSLCLFLAFLMVRLANPDLWHQGFGGEKPMDFAYFNGVLRSTVFPPVDPWFAGGYINYYYFGFVIVGSPVLLLGIMPSIAYNLIIPTLFSLTGMAAFSTAFNLVGAFQERKQFGVFGKDNLPRRIGNPWMAGIAALMLAVVLGNLDTPRVLIGEGLTATGLYGNAAALRDEYIADFAVANGQMPNAEQTAEIEARAIADAGDQLGSVVRGFRFILEGRLLNLPTNRWFWAPTRILSEPPVDSGGAIAEMPYFTFLYGDLHAHMIAMPLMLAVMGLLLHEVLVSGRDPRAWQRTGLALALIALVVGMFRATNTWDWPTFMLLAVFIIGFSWWLAWRTISRKSLINLLLRQTTFIVVSFAVVAPYTTWYAAIYSSAGLWLGNRTPLWAYFTVHGLFLVLIISLLVWETARWLRSIYVRDLRGKGPQLALLLLSCLFVLLLSVWLTVFGLYPLPLAGLASAPSPYPVTIVALPLLAWITLLFFRPNQSRVLQFVLALAGLGIGLTLGVEYIVIAGDVGRQNTVFKFYVQAWLLFSVVGGAAFAWLVQSSENWSAALRGAWLTLVSILVAVAALYPVMATRAKSVERMSYDVPVTLDGMEFMRHTRYVESINEVDPETRDPAPRSAILDLEDDWKAIRWLQENVDGTPRIIEGVSWREYLWGGRISIYTGLPTVLGWNWHQRQQRTFGAMGQIVYQRLYNVNAFYATPDVEMKLDMIQHYDVEYIIVSALEYAYYPQEGLLAFDEMAQRGLLEVVYTDTENTRAIYAVDNGALRLVYRYGGVMIYRVTPEGASPTAVVMGQGE